MHNHLTNTNIKSFKCFKDFKVEGLTRVNLITGQNNVGKTALMEALFIHSWAQSLPCFFSALSAIKIRREKLNIFFGEEQASRIKCLESVDGFSVDSNLNQSFFNVDSNNGIKNYIFKFAKQEIIVNSKDFSQEGKSIDDCIFIDNFGGSNLGIIGNFSAIQKLDKEDFLNNALNQFDSNISNFKIIDEKPQCKINGVYRPITELGDGTRHLASIIIALFKAQNGYLYVDEIDNGIHHSKLDELWEIILTISQQYSVQVFAVSHSKECLDSYARVAKKLADKGVSLIELGRSNGELKNIVFNSEELIKEVLKGFDMRGWDK